jgi:hydroxymethylpyrimidine pyrophosphatase-like HAD family hydrolase
VVAIPAIAGKAHAAAHVLRTLGFAREECVAAGDSNNDAAMLRSGIAFVLVANASGDLVRAAEAAPQPHHYRACASHADGCVEGIEHFHTSR